MKKFMCTIIALSILTAGLMSAGCGTSEKAQAGESYWVEKATGETHDDWPAGATVDISVVPVKDTTGQEVKVVRAAVKGTSSIHGVQVKDMQFRLSKFGGGGYEGPRFFREDGSLWVMMTRRDTTMKNFEKIGDEWESIIPLSWMCNGGTEAIGPYSVSLVSESTGGETSFHLGIDKDYLTVGVGVEKYEPAAHGLGIIISCQ